MRYALVSILTFAACSYRSVPMEGSPDVEREAEVVVHPDVKNFVKVSRRSQSRTEDGRLQIQIMFANEENRNVPLVVRTDWMDDHGRILHQSGPSQVLLTTGGTVLYEASSLDARATKYAVSVRGASEYRKD